MPQYLLAHQSEFIHSQCLLLFRTRFPAAALVGADGDLLALHYQSLADIGTLPAAAQTCRQYFQLSPGEVVLMNDPYSGGSILSSVNLIMAADECLLVVRVPFRPHVPLAKSVDQEGVRIPPTPLVVKGQLNQDFLSAVAGHPMAPKNFVPVVTQTVQKMSEWRKRFATIVQISESPWTRKWQREWMDLAEQQAEAHISELSEGDGRWETQFGGASRLVMQLQIQGQRVSFNFTGSGAPDQLALSDAATQGACVGALASTLPHALPITSGLLRRVDVIAPLGSNVHAKYPAPVYLGFTEGTSIIANGVIKLLGQIDRKLQCGLSGIGRSAVELNFSDGQFYFEDVDPGLAARPNKKGTPALDPFLRTHLHRSIEASEKLFPLRFISVAIRSDSGGSGQWKGGDGMSKVIEVLKPATLRWSQAPHTVRPEGAMGGKSALPSEIQVQTSEGVLELEGRGEMKLDSGSQVILKSGGGGGVGAPA